MAVAHRTRRRGTKWTFVKCRMLTVLFISMSMLATICYRFAYLFLAAPVADAKGTMASATGAATPSQPSAPKYIRPPKFDEALQAFADNLLMKNIQGDPMQPSDNFTDIIARPGLGVALPYDAVSTVSSEQGDWEACDQLDADFTAERDRLCIRYLSNINNMRYIKAMSSKLLYGRTIKFKISYAHNEVQAVVKVSQGKFFHEALSEVAAFGVDRVLNFSRVPPTVLTALPLDYMRVAAAFSPLLSQWVRNAIFEDVKAKRDMTPCAYPSQELQDGNSSCILVSVQLWMHDVHSALSTFLALPYKFDHAFVKKYFIPGSSSWPPKDSRFRAIGELNDRFIFDFIIGNGDRGMNDHNNFAYGGCYRGGACARPTRSRRIKGLAKYAFLDHGSGFYSHIEPKGNAFSGDMSNVTVCRFRRRTYDALKVYDEPPSAYRSLPLVAQVRRLLHPHVFKGVSLSAMFAIQSRLEKVLRVVERCVQKYGPEEVFSLPPYWEINVPEEWEVPDAEYRSEDRGYD